MSESDPSNLAAPLSALTLLADLSSLPRLLSDLRTEHEVLKKSNTELQTKLDSLQTDHDRLASLVVALAVESNTKTDDTRPPPSNGKSVARKPVADAPPADATTPADIAGPADAALDGLMRRVAALEETIATLQPQNPDSTTVTTDSKPDATDMLLSEHSTRLQALESSLSPITTGGLTWQVSKLNDWCEQLQSSVGELTREQLDHGWGKRSAFYGYAGVPPPPPPPPPPPAEPTPPAVMVDVTSRSKIAALTERLDALTTKVDRGMEHAAQVDRQHLELYKIVASLRETLAHPRFNTLPQLRTLAEDVALLKATNNQPSPSSSGVSGGLPAGFMDKLETIQKECKTLAAEVKWLAKDSEKEPRDVRPLQAAVNGILAREKTAKLDIGWLKDAVQQEQKRTFDLGRRVDKSVDQLRAVQMQSDGQERRLLALSKGAEESRESLLRLAKITSELGSPRRFAKETATESEKLREEKELNKLSESVEEMQMGMVRLYRHIDELRRILGCTEPGWD